MSKEMKKHDMLSYMNLKYVDIQLPSHLQKSFTSKSNNGKEVTALFSQIQYIQHQASNI